MPLARALLFFSSCFPLFFPFRSFPCPLSIPLCLPSPSSSSTLHTLIALSLSLASARAGDLTYISSSLALKAGLFLGLEERRLKRAASSARASRGDGKTERGREIRNFGTFDRFFFLPFRRLLLGTAIDAYRVGVLSQRSSVERFFFALLWLGVCIGSKVWRAMVWFYVGRVAEVTAGIFRKGRV